MDRMVAIASTAPAAPNRWPIIDLVLLIGMRAACWPKTVLMACVSERSFSWVDVPWALM